MANVWFVQRVGRDWKKVGDQPAFQRPLSELVFKLDLGTHRCITGDEIPEPDDGTTDPVGPRTKVFVEVAEHDLKESYFGGYFPGWYDSPYSAPEVSRRLGQAESPDHKPHASFQKSLEE